MRALLRRSAESFVVHTGLASASRIRHRGRSLILAYHNIVPKGAAAAGDHSLHLAQERFGKQLDLLARACRVVPLAELLSDERRSGGSTTAPRVAITFDDAYRGALTAGLDELRKRGMPATVFVAPGVLTQSFWWDAYLHDAGEERRRVALGECGGQAARVDAEAASRGWNRHASPHHAHAVSLGELQLAVGGGGLALGSHTWSHPSLPSLSHRDLDTELTSSLQWLRQQFESSMIPGLAYPYGHMNATVASAAETAGYRWAFRVSGGWVPRPVNDRFSLPRCNVPAGISDDGFLLRISGLLAR